MVARFQFSVSFVIKSSCSVLYTCQIAPFICLLSEILFLIFHISLNLTSIAKSFVHTVNVSE
jgi:hypothetical protein